MAGLVVLSSYGLLVPSQVRCGLPGSVGCPGGVFGPAVAAAGTGVQWFDVVMYDWGFWIVDSTSGANETNSWNVFEGWTVHVNATSQSPSVAIGGTAYHGLGVEINATGRQLLSLAAPVGKWVSASFVAPTAEYHHQHLWCTIECGPGHGSQQTWVLNVVPPTILPVARESANVTSGRAPLSVAFGANATLGSAPYNFTWNFGDGSPPAYGPAAGHTYALGGVYYAGLTVTDAKGYQGTSSVTVTVLSGAPLSAVLTATPPRSVAPALESFSVASHGGTPPYQYSWNFGDGMSTAGNNTSRHLYWGPGLYAVLVTVTDSAGARVSSIAPVSLVPPSGTLAVSLNVPTASGSAPFVVGMNATVSGATAPVSYLWDLGDGSIATGTNVSHTFNSSGSYEVRLFAVDAAGHEGSATHAISVTAAVLGGGGNGSDDNGSGGVDLAPATVTPSFPAASAGLSALLSVGPSSGPAPLAVVATVSVVGGTGLNETVSLNYGDGATGSGQVSAHTYSSEGSYVLTATVRDSGGNSASASASVVVGGPVVSVVDNTSIGDTPFSVLAAASVTGGSGVYGPLAWEFGDGTAGSGNLTNHTYAANVSGNVTLRARVVDSAGVAGTGVALLRVFPPPTAHLTVLWPAAGGLPETVGFALTVLGGSGAYSSLPLWTYGDGTSGRAPPTSNHAFARFGSYLVTVTTNDSYGRAASASVWVNLSLNLSLPKGTAPVWQLTGVADPFTASLALLGMVGATGLVFLVRKRTRASRRPLRPSSPPARPPAAEGGGAPPKRSE